MAEPPLTGIEPEQVTLAIEGWNAQDLESRQLFERCLSSLAAQVYPVHRCQVLVIVDAAVAKEEINWVKDYLPTASVVPVPAATYCRIKNRAIATARGEVLVLADSDVRYAEDWLTSLIGCLTSGNDMVVGSTQFDDGPLSRTLNMTDWSARRLASGPGDWFHANNLAMRRSVFERIRFREDIGISAGGSLNVLREQLHQMGIVPYFCLEAKGLHHLAPFWLKRLRIGGYHVQYRRAAPEAEWSWLVRVPILAPMLVTGGTLVRAYQRAWRLRSALPLGGLSLPLYLVSIAAVKAVECLGAAMVIWAPRWVSRRFGWFDVPHDPNQASQPA